PQLFPTLALLPWTARAEAPGHAELASLYLTEPLRLVVPWLGAMNATPSFLGAAALVLAAIAVAGRRRRAALLVIVAVLACSVGALVGISSLRAGTVALVSPINLQVFRWNPAPSRLTLLGVRYLVAGSDKCARLESRMHWKLVEENEEFCVFENPIRTERFGL